MPGNSSTSFIPKRTPTKKKKRGAARRIYIIAYVAYVVFFGTLIATAGVYVYKLQVNSQLIAQQEALVAEREKFSQADMERVLELEKRIEYAKERVERHVSITSFFESLEASVAETVQFAGIQLDRVEVVDEESGEFRGEYIEMDVNTLTDSFDSTIFQRRVLAQNDSIADITIEDLGLAIQAPSEDEEEDGQPQDRLSILTEAQQEATRVRFNMILEVPRENIPFDPFAYSVTDTAATGTSGQGSGTSSNAAGSGLQGLGGASNIGNI